MPLHPPRPAQSRAGALLTHCLIYAIIYQDHTEQNLKPGARICIHFSSTVSSWRLPWWVELWELYCTPQFLQPTGTTFRSMRGAWGSTTFPPSRAACSGRPRSPSPAFLSGHSSRKWISGSKPKPEQYGEADAVRIFVSRSHCRVHDDSARRDHLQSTEGRIMKKKRSWLLELRRKRWKKRIDEISQQLQFSVGNPADRAELHRQRAKLINKLTRT